MPDVAATGAPSAPGDSPRAGKLLLFFSDPASAGHLNLPPETCEVLQTADAESARRLYQEGTPDLVVLDLGAAAELLSEMARQEDGPPVIVLGPGEPADQRTQALESGAFAYLSSLADLNAWLVPTLRYRRLQLENSLIRKESDRIHTGLLMSYGAVSEQSHVLEAEVERRTLALHESEAQLRRYSQDLERQVEERTRQLVQQEKMAALGALVAGIAHDLHTPIGTITSNSDILSRSLARLRELIAGADASFRDNPDLKRVLSIVAEISRVNQLACDRIVGIVRSLRNFARLDAAQVESADVHQGLESTLTLVHHELKGRITVRREYGDIPPIECHPNQLNQVFMNLLVNAAQAVQGNGTVTIRTFREADTVKIQISDTGSGISPENLSRIFESGFTTKGAGVGTGLGLAICNRIIQDHKGRIEAESQAGKGATFTITLPLKWKTS